MALKLGKGSAFVKSRLRRLPQEFDDWEVDFLALADSWVGIAIEREHGWVLAMKMQHSTPDVNDLAHLLADAMQRPLIEGERHRPRRIRLRENPEWQELVPHLEQLRIEVVFSDDLSDWDAAAAEYEAPLKDVVSSLGDKPSNEDDEDSSIHQRLSEVMQSILCPVAGCWLLHGGDSEYYFDAEAECHVLEVWPIGFEDPEGQEGNGQPAADPGVCYELAEFDFTELAKQVPLEHFHFSQRRSVFEICWEEGGRQMELRIHLVPIEVAEHI